LLHRLKASIGADGCGVLRRGTAQAISSSPRQQLKTDLLFALRVIA
jgi:hypothetical protein